MSDRILVVVAVMVIVAGLIALRSLDRKHKRRYMTAPPPTPRPSVILVPGLGGSILDGTWSFPKGSVPDWCTQTQTTPTKIWPSVDSVIDDCWVHEFSGTVSSSGTISSYAQVTPRGWGNTSGIAVLESFFGVADQPYFQAMITSLVGAGYDASRIYGAPYDFRLITNDSVLKNFISSFATLIDIAYESGGRIPVVIIGHSLGCIVTKLFFNLADPVTISKIGKFVSVAGPYGGATKALESVISGAQIGIPMVTDQFMQTLESKVGGVMWMIPYFSPGLTAKTQMQWSTSAVLSDSKTPKPDIPSTLVLSGNPGVANLVQPGGYVYGLWETIVKPPPSRIQVYLIYSYGIQTAGKLTYTGDYAKPSITTITGDGTVPMVSLLTPVTDYQWGIARDQIHPYYGVNHLALVSDANFLRDLVQEILV